MNNKKWAEDLLQKSNKLTTPYLEENGFQEDFFQENDLLKVLRETAQRDMDEVKIRVFIGSNLSYKYAIKVHENPPLENETIENWVQRIFGNQKFGLIINEAEKFHDDLTQRCAQLYEPVIDDWGTPEGGIGIVYFIGNYGYTPFGIHLDAKHYNVMHFHLGPGTKKLTLWDAETYVDKAKTDQPTFEPEKLLDYGHTYELTPKSFFVLPAEYYHIGCTNDFSIGLTIGFKKFTSQEIYQAAVSQASKHSFNYSISDNLKKGIDLDSIRVKKEFKQLNFDDWSKSILEDYSLAVKSNNGFIASPIKSNENYPNLSELKVTLTKPFQIFYKVIKEEHIVLFIRKRRITLAYHPALIKLIQKLNKGNIYQVQELIKTSKADYSEQNTLSVLEKLLNQKGIKICD